MALVRNVRHLGAKLMPTLSAERRDPAADFVRAGLFDLDYYRAQIRLAAKPDSLTEARRHYVAVGRAAGLSIHPLIEPEWWDPRAGSADEDALGRERWLIHGGMRGASTSSLISEPVGTIGESRAYLHDLLAGRATAAIPGGMSVGQATAKLTAVLGRILREAPNRGSASGVDWEAVRARVPERVIGRTSVLVPTFQDWRMTVEAVRAALAGADGVDGVDIEVVVVDNGSRLAVIRNLAAVFIAEPRVKLIRCSVNTNFAGGMNRAIADSTGENILLLNNDAILQPGWHDPLFAALDDPSVRGVQPLLLYPATNRIQSAGTVFLGEGVLPWHFLAGHPREDAQRMTMLDFHAITAAVMALRAVDVIAVGGFEEEFENGYEDVDLCLRLTVAESDRFQVVRESVAIHPEGSSPGRSARDSENRVRFFQRWGSRMPPPEADRYADVGMRLRGMRPLWYADDVPVLITDPVIERPRRTVAAADGSDRPILRWLLLTEMAERDEVDAALSVLDELGQECVEVRGGVHSSDGLADIVVAFSPSVPTFPRAGAFNVLIDPGGSRGPWQTTTDGAPTDVIRVIAAFESWRDRVFPSR